MLEHWKIFRCPNKCTEVVDKWHRTTFLQMFLLWSVWKHSLTVSVTAGVCFLILWLAFHKILKFWQLAYYNIHQFFKGDIDNGFRPDFNDFWSPSPGCAVRAQIFASLKKKSVDASTFDRPLLQKSSMYDPKALWHFDISSPFLQEWWLCTIVLLSFKWPYSNSSFSVSQFLIIIILVLWWLILIFHTAGLEHWQKQCKMVLNHFG